MSDLLDFVTEAHGGLELWSSVASVSAEVEIHGPTWERLGQRDLLGPCEVTALTARQQTTLRSRKSGYTIVFEGGRVTATSRDGQVEVLDEPRRSILGQGLNHPWTPAQVGYFIGYGLWSYLHEPYVLHWPGVQTQEIEPWQERGETWRRLEVTFPDSLATHERTIVYYFDSRTGLQRRMDYAPEVFGGRNLGAHYAFEHRFWDGVPVPSQRRVLRRDAAGVADHHNVVILLDFSSYQLNREA
jgi:hypothetical protein